jgi:hypothetical protein
MSHYIEIILSRHLLRLNCHTKTHLQEKSGKTIWVEGVRPTFCWDTNVKSPSIIDVSITKYCYKSTWRWKHNKQHVIFSNNLKLNINNINKKLNFNISELSFLVLVVNHYRLTFHETFLPYLLCRQQGHSFDIEIDTKSKFSNNSSVNRHWLSFKHILTIAQFSLMPNQHQEISLSRHRPRSNRHIEKHLCAQWRNKIWVKGLRPTS